jgi:5-formyltetrahydrofolate cyclo-ligase
LSALDGKGELRREYLKRRLELSSKEVGWKSLEVQKKCVDLKEFKEAKKVALYANFKNEVMTDFIFNESIKEGKKVFFPKIDVVKKRMCFCEIDSDDGLAKGCYGVLQPVSDKNISIEWVDIIFVPGLVFDIQGNRLGYGKGHYDKVLSALKGKKSVVGLAFEMQIAGEVPVCSHDVKMDKIITEDRIIDGL